MTAVPTTDPAAYFLPLAPYRFRPTRHAGGAWADDELHMAPVSGLLIHALETRLAELGRNALVISRITFDILGKITATDLQIEVEILRPGRTIELVQATAMAGDRAVVRATVWLLATSDTAAVSGGAPATLPGPAGLAEEPFTRNWGGGYVESVRLRPCGPVAPGRATVWLGTDIDLVDGIVVSPLARLVGLMDTANGIAIRQSPREWMFPNVDLTIHLYRAPVGDWLGLDTEVIFSAEGRGLTSSVLHDTNGPIGRAEQILTVRRIG